MWIFLFVGPLPSERSPFFVPPFFLHFDSSSVKREETTRKRRGFAKGDWFRTLFREHYVGKRKLGENLPKRVHVRSSEDKISARERERKKKSGEKSVVQKNNPEARKILEYRTRCTKQNFTEFSAIAHCKNDPIISINEAKHTLDPSPNLQMQHSNITQQKTTTRKHELSRPHFPRGPFLFLFYLDSTFFPTVLLISLLLSSSGEIVCCVSDLLDPPVPSRPQGDKSDTKSFPLSKVLLRRLALIQN